MFHPFAVQPCQSVLAAFLRGDSLDHHSSRIKSPVRAHRHRQVVSLDGAFPRSTCTNAISITSPTASSTSAVSSTSATKCASTTNGIIMIIILPPPAQQATTAPKHHTTSSTTATGPKQHGTTAPRHDTHSSTVTLHHNCQRRNQRRHHRRHLRHHIANTAPPQRSHLHR